MVDVLDSCIYCCVLCVLGSATCNSRFIRGESYFFSVHLFVVFKR